ncbi:MAG: hypothetical protein JXA30_12125 [Deltaproteobacteria bacterium]|nr:hypothetical protein [Deltaproteobacteria bacterium]
MRIYFSISIIAVVLSIALSVKAGGMELLPGGSKAAARGGASAARPDDPMTLLLNPAGMALIPGVQLLINTDIPFLDMCVDPYGYYGWGTVRRTGVSEFGDSGEVEYDDNGDPIIGATYATDPMDKLCNSAGVIPFPHVALVIPVIDGLSIGLGFVTSTMMTGIQWGGSDGTIKTEDGGRPTPTRYQLIRQKVAFGLDPTVGVAYRPLHWLQVGLSLQAYMADVESRVVQANDPTTSPHADMLVDLSADDYFLPALNFSIHATPITSLELMLGFRWMDDFNGSGRVVHTTNTYQEGNATEREPFKNEPIILDKVRVPFPWSMTFAIRYAELYRQRRTAKEKWHTERDPLYHELWDIELDVTYSFNKRSGTASIGFEKEDAEIIFLNPEPESIPVNAATINQFNFDRHLKDTIAVRLGGSYSVFPRLASINTGVFFESRGVDPDYANIDLFAFQRIGIGVGILTSFGAFESITSYTHIFEEEVLVAPPEHDDYFNSSSRDATKGFDKRVGGSEGVVLEDPDAPSPSEADGVARLRQSALADRDPQRFGRVVNAGKYTGGYDIISLGLVYRF